MEQTVPLSLELSPSDYHEFGTGSDHTFGYCAGDVTALVDILKGANDGDRGQVIGAIGMAVVH